MAFRDDTGALRERLASLGRELEALDEERRAIADARAALEADVEGEVRAMSRARPELVFAAAAAVMLGAAAAIRLFATAEGDGGTLMLFGEAAQVSGEAPIAAGAPCTVFVTDGDNWDAKVAVICADRVIYGGSNNGYLDCPEKLHFARCVDDGFTDESGDPRLELDRRRGVVRVTERRWAADLTIPAGVGR